MKKFFKTLSLSICLFGICGTICAQDAEKAAGYFNQYADAARRGNITVEAYDALLRAHKEYLAIMRSNPSGSEAHTHAQNMLADTYDPIQHSINFYNKNNMPDKLMMAARAYVDLMMYCPNLPINPMHIPITRLAAINTANLVAKTDPTPDGFSRAIPYLSAYIQTEDNTPENRIQQAYSQLGAFSYNIKDYSQAYKVLKQGLRAFSDDNQMLEYMLKTLQRIGKREDELQSYLTRALAINPDNQNLQELQANLYTKANNDEGAVEFLEKLHNNAPYHHGYMKSLAYHYCNLGFKGMEEADKLINKKQKSTQKEKARNYFSSAAKLLETLIDGEFSESERMRYSQALVYVYGYLDDKKKQDNIIDNIKDNGIAQLDAAVAFADLGTDAPATHHSIYGKNNFNSEDKRNVNFSLEDVRNCDVDVNIPMAELENSQTFVVIIANENYENTGKVDFAHNDGSKFMEYCHLALGIPEENIHIRKDATGGHIRKEISWLQKATAAFSNANVLFYYAGHGMPDEKTMNSYLIPSDGSPSDPSSNYSLNDLYTRLSALPAEHVYVFMDACFSGAQRGDGMLLSARTAVRPAKKEEPQGKMVVFSAAQGDETAFPYKEKQHGLFTYFLLKKLQESGGNVTLSELGEYITTNVKQTAFKVNDKLQTPCVSGSLMMSDGWENLPLVSITLHNSLD